MVWHNRILFNVLGCTINNIMEGFIVEECREDDMEWTNCCGAPFTYPGWPDSDLCSACNEHAEPMKDEETV